jgi:hypothetical protein
MYCCLCWMMTRYKIYFLCAVTCKIRPSRIEISFWHVFLFPKYENAVKGMKVQRCCWDATWIPCAGGQHRQMGGTEMHPTVGVALGPVYKLQGQSTWNRTIPACNWVLHCYIPSLDTFGSYLCPSLQYQLLSLVAHDPDIISPFPTLCTVIFATHFILVPWR